MGDTSSTSDNGNDTLHGGDGNDSLAGAGSSNDQLFGDNGNDQLLFGDHGVNYDGGDGHDALKVTGNEDFTRFNENVSNTEILDMRSGANDTVTINAADVLDFGGSTGESFYGNAIDLVVRGDSGDTLNLNNDGAGHSFTQVATGVTLSDAAAYGSGTHNIYSDGNGNVVAVDSTIAAANVHAN